MNFGQAIDSMGSGYKVSRQGWNGKGMFLFLIPIDWEFYSDIEGIEGLPTEPFICMKTADNKLIPWLASQADLLAEDWGIVG